MIPVCGKCRHWSPMFPEYMADDDPGECNFPVPIPHAWRWATREKSGVARDEVSDCKYFDPERDQRRDKATMALNA